MQIYIGALDLKKKLLSFTVVGNSLMSFCLALWEVSPITLLLHYDNLARHEEMVLTMHSSKVWCSTMRATIKATVKGLYELGEW